MPNAPFHYVALGPSEARHFPHLDAALIQRKVRSWYLTIPGGRIYRVSGDDLGKLPEDPEGRERYLGDDDFGYRIFPMWDNATAEDTRSAELWTPIYEETT